MFNSQKIILLLVIVLAAGFAGGFYFNEFSDFGTGIGRDFVNRAVGQPDGVDFSLFWNVWNQLQDKYVDSEDLNSQELLYGAIDGLVNAVGDPYTVFMQPKESENFAQEISGTFGGVGIEIGLRNNILTVIAPIKDTPADRAGLMAGDKIVKIGDKSTESMKISEAVNLIRGPKGTPIKLTISRGEKNSSSKEVTIVRGTIRVPTVAWKMLSGDIAYIQLFVFNRNVDNDIEKAVREIQKSNARRLILDLRNNPGGLLDSAVNIAGYFIDGGLTVTEERTNDGQKQVFEAPNHGQLKNYPLVILINKGSASASEILAGAIKDHRGVLLVGEKSFGKGSVQEVSELPGKSSLKVTVAKWFTPKGTSINDNGIEPDYSVERTEDDINNERDPQLDKAEELVRGLR